MEADQMWPGWDTVRTIGSGGFGEVYEIQKTDSTGSYRSALKVISIPKSADEYREYADNGYDDKSITAIFKSQVDDIVSEFKMMSQFKGTSNIVSYEDHMIVPHGNGRGWDVLIRMELLTSLPDYINQYGLTEGQVIQLGQNICHALELCGQRDIIHRDIKPQNIFVNEFGDFKLGDFGIARTMDHTTKATKTGTYSYMAPEVYSGRSYGASVDIYSLGLVLYWLLNERRQPFEPMPPSGLTAPQINEAQMKRLSGDRIPEPKYGNGALKAAVLKACSFDAAQRFASPKMFCQALNTGGQDQNTIVLSPKFQAESQNINGPSREATDYTTGSWSMKFEPKPKREKQRQGETTKGTWDDSGPIHWKSPDSSGKDTPDQPPPTWTEQDPPPPKKENPSREETLKAEKKQRRSIRLWAVWLFLWVGAGIGQLGIHPNLSGGYIILSLIAIAIGVIPFVLNVRRRLEESNHNPRVRKTLFISIGVVAALFLLVLVGTLAEKNAKNSMDSRPGSSYWVENSSNAEIPYTKGELNGNIYRNDWAGLSFSLPEGFENASEDYYALYDGMDSVECGLYLISNDGEQIIIGFEKLSSSRITENMYLDSAVSNFSKAFQSQGASMITDGKDRQDFFIGAERYTKAQIDYSYVNSVQLAVSFYVRKIDDRVCCIQILGASETDNDNLAQLLDGIKQPSSGDNQITDGPAYTKGTFDGITYVNEWADLQLFLPEGFYDAPEEKYAAYNDPTGSELGLLLTNDTGASCAVIFSDCPYVVTAEYFDTCVEATVAQNTEQGGSAEWDGQHKDIRIAANTYFGAHINFNVNGIVVVQNLYLRQIDEKLCQIVVTGPSQDANNAIAAQFTPCGSY